MKLNKIIDSNTKLFISNIYIEDMIKININPAKEKVKANYYNKNKGLEFQAETSGSSIHGEFKNENKINFTKKITSLYEQAKKRKRKK